METNSTHEGVVSLESLSPDLHAHLSRFLPVVSLKQLLQVSTITRDKQLHPSRVENLRVHLRTERSLDAFVSAAKEGLSVQHFGSHPIIKLKLNKRTTGTGLAELKENGLLDCIVNLDLRQCFKITDSDLVPIFTLRNLHSLILASTNISDEGIRRLLELSNLVSLDLAHCKKITREGISRLGGSRLESINLCRTGGVTDIGLHSISRLPNLKTLDLTGQHTITDEGLRYISRLPNIKTLRVCQCIQHLSHLETLEELVLANSGGVTDDSLRKFSELGKLESLDLTGCKQITSVGLGYIATSASLRKLVLCGVNFTDEGIEALQGMDLLSLEVSCSDSITDRSLESISHLSNLESLCLFSCNAITNEGLRHLSKLNSLNELELHYSRICGKGLMHISSLVNLTSLNLGSLGEITAENMMALSCLTKLQTLYWRNGVISDQGMQHLSNLLDLKSLILSDCRNISDQGLVHLSNLLELEELQLTNCKKISDQGLCHLSKLSGLRVLGVAGCNITDAGLQQIARSHELLELLAVGDRSKISHGGIEYLEQRNPNTNLSIIGGPKRTRRGNKRRTRRGNKRKRG